MIRQILVAKTVNGDDIVLQTVNDVEGIKDIRETLKVAGAKRHFSIEVDGEDVELAYLEKWSRDSGVDRVQPLKTREEVESFKKQLGEVKTSAPKAEDIEKVIEEIEPVATPEPTLDEDTADDTEPPVEGTDENHGSTEPEPNPDTEPEAEGDGEPEEKPKARRGRGKRK